MKLIIDIPDDRLRRFCKDHQDPIYKLVGNGIPYEERQQGECMTIICTEEQKKAIINAQFCPFIGKCPFYSQEHGAKYETCKQCREDNIEWKID